LRSPDRDSRWRTTRAWPQRRSACEAHGSASPRAGSAPPRPVQVGGPGDAVGDARDADLAEHRGQAAGVTALGVGVLDSGCVGYVDQSLCSLARTSRWSCRSCRSSCARRPGAAPPVPRATVAPIPRRPARPPPPRTVPVRRRTPHPWAGLRMLAPSFPSRALSWRRPGALPEGSQSHQPATSNAGMSSAVAPLQKSCTQINYDPASRVRAGAADR
jgi:hypothetical protein